MTDIYNTDSKFAGVFKGTTFSLSIAGATSTVAGALVQSVQLSYARQISRFWELGSTNQYYIAGRCEGAGSLSQLVGPKGFISNIIAQLGDACTADKNTIQLTAGSSTCAFSDTQGNSAAQQSLTLAGAVMTNFTMGANAQNFVVDTGIQIMYTSLSATGTAA